MARIAIDTGATSSLISEALASHLQVKRHPHRLAIEGACGNGVSKHYVQVTFQSNVDSKRSTTVRLSVIPKLPSAHPPLRKEDIAANPHVRDLPLADPDFGGPLDALIGGMDSWKCFTGSFKYHPEPDIIISPTIFGWTIAGQQDYTPPTSVLKVHLKEDSLQQALQKLWELDQLPDTLKLDLADEAVVHHFEDTHSIQSNGRYVVRLPRKTDAPELGTSRHIAHRRFLQNEKSMERKGKLQDFNLAMQEYLNLQHAELVPHDELDLPSYYLPVHGVFKETSSTTKLRPVFDASARSSNGTSLNDTLETGPNLYPLLTDVLIRFRVHKIGFSSDISKMFREIVLHQSERDSHRFLIRCPDNQIRDHRMLRLTFGIKSSPFLATKVIQHLAQKHKSTHPLASSAIFNDFYVDDYLAGASTVQEAQQLREQLCKLLKIAGMNLRKWRTSSSEFRDSIPVELIETEDLQLPISKDTPKALGIHWEVSSDVLRISVPTLKLEPENKTTKRQIASLSAKVFDVLGLFAPFVIWAKMLLQRLWQLQLSWDQAVPDDAQQTWQEWIDDLPLIASHSISRRYTLNDKTVQYTSLHGFSDASNRAYGAVVYLRQVHEDTSVSVSLVFAKARVSPLKTITIPRAELLAAHMLAKVLTYVANLLHVPKDCLYAWTDSTIVLCWLSKSPASLKTFVSHRIAAIKELLPGKYWRHVPTQDNPADLISRGASASRLLESALWWKSPKWLLTQPQSWPSQNFSNPKFVPEALTSTSLLATTSTSQTEEFWSSFSSF